MGPASHDTGVGPYPFSSANIVPNIVSVLPAQNTNIQRMSFVSSEA